ncbi:glycoside hydrolase family 79 protein [Ilyonectria sp. MPI-CAGE-AT-0026]|nr:glycoside hydrolase family 79 protein [Ilyonectria sp. MPI-CAGE-AT-0026]
MGSSLRLALTVAVYGVSASFAVAEPIQLSSPEKVPVGASWVVPHDFASFSFPAHFFTDYTGNLTNPNLFSRDIFDLLYSKTGAHPFTLWYNASQEIAAYNWWNTTASFTTQYGIPDMVYIGPHFFDGFLNFPGTRWSWQLNMGNTFGKKGGLENAIEVAKIVMDYTKNSLESFELGNEPDLMVPFGHRAAGYSMGDYVREWNEYAANTSELVLKNNKYGLAKRRFFQGLLIAGADKPGWDFEESFQDGLDRHGFVKSISYHQYAARNQEWVRLQNSYMNHTANAHNVTQYENIIESCHEYHPALPFVLGETNSNSYNLNMSQIEGVFGSALWLIDHLLMGMATNITRYNLIQGTTFGYSAWVPVTRDGVKPHVRAPLYGQIFAADVLGHHPKVQVYPIPQLPWNVSAYGIYESGSLAKYVVINFDEWNSTTRYERPVQKITLDLPLWVKNVKVERLTANGASADNDIKWAGQSWNYTSGRLTKTGAKFWEGYTVKKGRVGVDLRSTEAMLVSVC